MDIKKIISEMTLEEKAGLCSGADFWRTKAVERLGVPKIHMSDGPYGLRKQAEKGDHLGVNDSIEAVCFPAACGTTASFDRELVREMGETIGEECRAENVAVILGPAVNIKRSPLCGRNFEYMSEDPYLAGEMAASYINGVQSKAVGTSIKHFALNSQEHERLAASSEADERTMREIYLAAFEKAVKNSRPWTVMCSYNRINGTFASEHPWLLKELLKGEWGFEGFVVSDWGAVNDRVKGLAAGLDLEMPSSNGCNDRLIVEAVRDGRLSEEALDEAVARILRIVDMYVSHETTREYVFDKEKDHNKAVEIAAESMVLLKNEDGILPLQEKEEGILFVGGFAENPRFQGGGSSHINSFRVSQALQECRKRADISYAKGFAADSDEVDEKLLTEAVAAAKKAKKVIIFAGLPDSYESEGYDRRHMHLPQVQDRLITEISAVNPQVAVVLHNGSPVEMPWIGDVKAVLESYLGGEGVGEAQAALLFGEKNPCAKLAETFPKKLSDTPSYLNFPGKGKKVFYREGLFVGYRYYDKKEMEVLFPFGHGLSYTTFALSNLRLDKTEAKDTEEIRVSVDVKNTGSIAGKEVVQLYVSDCTDTELRPERELKGFCKVALLPGETKTVEMVLDRRAFAYYDTAEKDWVVPEGAFQILVGTSSREIPLQETVHLHPSVKKKFSADTNTMIGELMERPALYEALKEKLLPRFEALFPKKNQDKGKAAQEAITEEMEAAMLKYTPLRTMRSFNNITNEEVDEIVRIINETAEKLDGA